MRLRRFWTGTAWGLGVGLAIAAGGVPATGGCTTHQCDGDIACIDSTGSMKVVANASECTPVLTGGTPIPSYSLDVTDIGGELDWFTSPLLGPWIDFPGQRTYIINLPPGLAGHELLNFYPAVTSDTDAATPDAPRANWTPASGQLSEFTNAGGVQQISVFNDTCVEYGLRLEVRALAAPTDEGDSGSGAPDTSTEAADASDAGAIE